MPVIRRCMTRVSSPSSRSSRYLPRRPSDSIRRPLTAAPSASGATGRDQRGSSTSSRSIRRPAISGSSWRQIVSTSGSSGIRARSRSALAPSTDSASRSERSSGSNAIRFASANWAGRAKASITYSTLGL